jgi:Polysaccharide deacetylase
VVLTFDDGPWPPTTSRVLAILARECVHATFFLIGRNASAHPELARRIASEGHTIGTHTWSHPSLKRIKPEAAIAEIDHGISTVETALRGTTTPVAPFFRFPGFESTPATLDLLQSRRIVVFGADLWASDWNRMTPPARALSSSTIPRLKRPRCYRPSCGIFATTAITSSTSNRLNLRRPAGTSGVDLTWATCLAANSKSEGQIPNSARNIYLPAVL